MKSLILVLFCGLVLMSCKSSTKSTGDQPKATQSFEVQQDSINKLVQATEEKFKAMTDSQLISELEQSAMQGREPFNSAPFREVLKRKEAAPALAQSITDSTQREYFKLMALKKLDESLYGKIKATTGASILTDALAKSETFNAWGLPNEYWESSARAIIEYGPVAVKYLIPLLKDQRPAPVWGSEEAAIYERNKYRVCDYALALLMAIQKDQATLPESPKERDALIERYLNPKK